MVGGATMNDDPTEAEISALTSVEAFKRTYHKVLIELDALHKGAFDNDGAESVAALCLLSQGALIASQAAAELRAKSLKGDIEFKKAEVYLELRKNPPDGDKKTTETALNNMVIRNQAVHALTLDQFQAEKESKELANILSMLKDAHLTFRALIKRGI
jgi:hypothetical protein